MNKMFRFTVTRTGKAFKKVFSGLPDTVGDDIYYHGTFDGTVLMWFKLIWSLTFPPKKPIFIWEQTE